MELATRVQCLLIAKGWTLGTAESCTGGLVSHWVTSVSGSSRVFVGGVVAYANEVKRDVLGVAEETLRQHGAVSAPVALAMAQGIRRLLHTDVGISSTGIAGPTGGTAAKPVGTVFVAISSPLGDRVAQYRWEGDRAENLRLSAAAALRLIEEDLG